MSKRFLYVFCDKVSRNCGPIIELENEATLSRWFKEVVSSGFVPQHIIRDTVVYKVGHVAVVNGVPSCTGCQPEIVLRGDDFIDCTSEANSDASDSDAL